MKTALLKNFIKLGCVLCLTPLVAYTGSNTSTLVLQGTVAPMAAVSINNGNAVMVNTSVNGAALGLPGSQIQQTSQVHLGCTNGTNLSLSLSSQKNFRFINADGSVSIPYSITTSGNSALTSLTSSGNQVNLNCDGTATDFQLNIATDTLSTGLPIGVYTDIITVNMAY